MVFKITVARQPTAVEFEAGSISEAIGIIQTEESEFTKLFGFSFHHDSTVDEAAPPSDGAGVATAAAPDKPKRGRKAAEATAPAPMPIPAAAAPPTPPAALTIPADGSIPPFLDRTAAPPPPPVMPNAPPVAPAAPVPSFVLGNKIADNLQVRYDKSKDVDQGATLLAWLMEPTIAGPLVVPGATVPEILAVLRMTSDDKVRHLLAPLELAA